MPVKMNYPADADNNFKKYYICYHLQQKLQDKHNEIGEKYKNKKITKKEWETFHDAWFEPRMRLVLNEVLRLRQLAKNHDWGVNIDDIFIEE